MDEPVNTCTPNTNIASMNNETEILNPINQNQESTIKHGYGLKDPQYFYLTTNRKEFDGKQGMPAFMARPQSTAFNPSNKTFLTSLYQDDFCGKKGNQELPQRSGTSSGNRKNKPHPPESFMIWKFPGKLPPLGKVDDLNDEILQKLAKESHKTTYEVDYTLYHENNDIKEELDNCYPTLKKYKPPYTLDSTNRFEFQQPKMHSNLKNNTSRYGCNERRYMPAIGVVPNIADNTSNTFHTRQNTSYSEEFKYKTANLNTREMSARKSKFNKYIANNNNNDDANVTRLMKKLADLDETNKIGLTRLSDWEGPR